jgi:hypothetical protein
MKDEDYPFYAIDDNLDEARKLLRYADQIVWMAFPEVEGPPPTDLLEAQILWTRAEALLKEAMGKIEALAAADRRRFLEDDDWWSRDK